LPVDKSAESDSFIREIVRDGLLIVSGRHAQFPHLSFQEFLTARDLMGDPHARRSTFVLNRYLRGDDWWREVLGFYIGLSGKTKELREWVKSATKKLNDVSKYTVEAQAGVLYEMISIAATRLE
jgi:hypothetical protein